MRSTLFRAASIVAVLILFTTLLSAGTKCRSSDFACFKRKMMPQVGHQITVVGVLASAKLGWIVTFKHWGVYIYATQESDSDRMKALDSFHGQTVKGTGTLRYAPGSPSQSPETASVPEHFFFAVAEVRVISAGTPAEIRFREMRLRKPPLAELYFDVVLRNDRTEPRWFLLPSNLGPGTPSIATKGGVDGLEVFAPRGKGRVIIGHFLGTGGFHALLLPAHAELHLRMFSISFWGDLPDRLQIDVVVAKRLVIGGEQARAWFRVNPMCSARADVAESSLSQTRMLRSRYTPDRKEVGTLIKEERRSTVEVSLKRTE